MLPSTPDRMTVVAQAAPVRNIVQAVIALWRYVKTGGLVPTVRRPEGLNRPEGRRSVQGRRATAKSPGCDTPLSGRVPSTSAPVHAGSWSGSLSPDRM